MAQRARVERAAPMKFTLQHLDSGIVLVTIAGTATMQDARLALAEAEGEYRTWTSPRCVVYDLQVQDVRADVRSLMTTWRSENRALIGNAIYGGAYVVPSSIVRGLLTALNWVSVANVGRTAYCQSRAEAILQCEAWNAERTR